MSGGIRHPDLSEPLVHSRLSSQRCKRAVASVALDALMRVELWSFAIMHRQTTTAAPIAGDLYNARPVFCDSLPGIRRPT